MSDANCSIGASNIFDVGANFYTQSSSSSGSSAQAMAQDSSGNVACESVIYDITSFTQSLKYCGDDFTTDFVDGRAAPVSFLENFGCVFGDGLVEGVSISMTAADKCSIELTGHQHDQNPHDAGLTPTGATRSDALALGIADVLHFLPAGIGEAFEAWNGFGVPDFGITLGDDATPKSATVTFSLDHKDETDEQGKHFFGKSIMPKCELSIDGVGIPTSMISDDAAVRALLLDANFAANTNAMLGCVTTDSAQNDSNTEVDTWSLTAHAYTDLLTV